jgi:protein-tyrosine-phosphatase
VRRERLPQPDGGGVRTPAGRWAHRCIERRIAPAGLVHPQAIASMRRAGYDIATQDSKSVDSVTGHFDAIVTMGCGDACPSVPAARRLDWLIPDPKGLPAAEFDAVRDRIEAAVRALLATL